MPRIAPPRRGKFLLGLGLGLVVAAAAGLAIAALTRPAARFTDVSVAPSFSPPGEIPAGTDVVLAVGDIAVCGEPNDELTGQLVAEMEGPILGLGDLAYESGTQAEFEQCFDSSWGAVKQRIHPVPGNHEYHTAGAGPYFEHFGDAAGTPGLGWYSFDVGDWHLIALNSNCGTRTNFCSDDSPQGDWLEADLALHRTECTLAFWHHPRWSSGEHGSDPVLGELWTMLYDGGVDVVLTGHDHDYERFAPMDAQGGADPASGIRSFIVGTGGRALDPFGPTQPNSEARNNVSYGVLRMALYADNYTWEFVPTTDDGFRDAGSGTCH